MEVIPILVLNALVPALFVGGLVLLLSKIFLPVRILFACLTVIAADIVIATAMAYGFFGFGLLPVKRGFNAMLHYYYGEFAMRATVFWIAAIVFVTKAYAVGKIQLAATLIIAIALVEVLLFLIEVPYSPLSIGSPLRLLVRIVIYLYLALIFRDRVLVRNA